MLRKESCPTFERKAVLRLLIIGMQGSPINTLKIFWFFQQLSETFSKLTAFYRVWHSRLLLNSCNKQRQTQSETEVSALLETILGKRETK
jgi:hypothetical protein